MSTLVKYFKDYFKSLSLIGKIIYGVILVALEYGILTMCKGVFQCIFGILVGLGFTLFAAFILSKFRK